MRSKILTTYIELTIYSLTVRVIYELYYIPVFGRHIFGYVCRGVGLSNILSDKSNEG